MRTLASWSHLPGLPRGAAWILLLLLVAWPAPLGAAEQPRPVFGPEEFVITAGATEIFDRPFTVPASTSAPFTLCLVNGEPEEQERRSERCPVRELRRQDTDDEDDRDEEHKRHGKNEKPKDPEAVTQGHVLVDGREVVSARDFSKHDEVIEKSLRLTAGHHSLTVELHGPPGSHITLAIVGVIRLGKLAQARAGHTATLLSDGTVLLTGGRGRDKEVLSSAEVFDPTSLQSALLSVELTTPRTEHTATLLPNGEVLYAAGRDRHGPLFSAELFQRDGTFNGLPASVQIPRAGHTATLLPDGRVVILGGLDVSRQPLDQGETFDLPSGALYDPRTGAFALLPQALTVPRHHHSATLLPSSSAQNGLVLVVGGRHEDEVLASAELFDPATGESTLLDGHLRTARAQHTASLLNDGRVLIVGGRGKRDALDSVEVFDPATQTFSELRPKLKEERVNHTATVLPTGEILLAGGREDEDKDPTKDTELYLQPGRDTTPPTVLIITPASAATEVSLTPLIAIQFSEPIKVTTLTNGSLVLVGSTGSVPGIVSPGEEGLLAFFIPAAPLAPGTAYTLHLQDLTDRAGNHLAPVTTQFTTASVLSAGLSIDGFSPMSGPVGTAVTITGQNFDAVAANNQVKFNGTTAIITSVNTTGTSITTTVPQGATTGRITVTTPQDSATSEQDFTVTTPDFTISALPTPLTVAAVGQGAFAVSLSGTGGFTNLATLSVTGVPSGMTATFSAATLTMGQSAFLTMTTNGTTPAGTYPLSVNATGLANGVQTTRSVTTNVQVLGAGTTTLSGQVLDEDAKPVKNALVKLGALQVSTDDGGNFLLQNPPAGVDQLFLIDGGPASTPQHNFPIIPYKVTIVAGQANTLGFTVYLHFQKTTGMVDISNSSVERVVTDPTIPGFQMTIPSGVSITGWDGQPNTQISTRRVPVDRVPLPPFPSDRISPVVYMDYFGKPGGGTPSEPIPIIFPNDLDLSPGTQVELWFYDEAPDGSRPNQWAQYGTGTVSADGSQVIPDIDPATGKPYGQPRFCCGAARLALLRAQLAAILGLVGGTPTSPGGEKGAEPVDLATGFFVYEKTDLTLPGRLPVVFARTYRTQGASGGPFGPGTSHTFQVFLMIQNNLRTLALPSGVRLPFSRRPDGTFRSVTDPSVQGAILTDTGTGHTLRFKDGTTWTFGPPVPGAAIFIGQDVALLVSQADRNGNIITLSRSGSAQNITTITAPDGRQITLSYDGANRITRITDPLGRAVSYLYDAAGRLSHVIDPMLNITRHTYDSAGRMLTITDPRGITFLTNEYDADGRVRKQMQADGGIWQLAYTSTAGIITQTTVTDPRGNTTTTRFNGRGYGLGRTDGLGQASTVTRDPSSNVLSATTDPLNRSTRFTYDVAGNATSITDPANQVTSFVYGPTFNRVTQITDALNQITEFTYDPANGNLLTTKDPLNHVTTITYNQFGQPTSVQGPIPSEPPTTFAYDTQGNLITTTDPEGNVTQRAYDAVSRLLALTDPRGLITQFRYDNLNRVTEIADARQGITRFAYDPNGNLLTVTDAKNQTTTYTYDSMDRLATRKDALNREESYQYEPAGNLTQFRDRKNQVTTFQYDALNRRIRADYADGTFTTFTYDAAGRLIAAEDSLIGRIDFVYDVLDRLIKEVSAQGVVEYTYDALGRRMTMAANGQAAVTYGYDPASRLIQVAQAGLVVGLGYDAAGRRTSLSYPNGTSTSYTYDNASRLTNIAHNGPPGIIESLTYAYDAAGNRISLTRTTGAATLLPAAVQAAYDASNEQIQFNSASPNQTFDANGNLTDQTDPTDPTKHTTYTWDARNRLVAISGPGLSASFAYDALGRRLSKTINGVTTQFLYDGNDIVQEIAGGAVGARYLRSLNIDEAFVRLSTSLAYYHSDALGSALALTDQIGTTQSTYSYEAFGKTTTTGASINSFQFTGRENDGTGLYFSRFRYYDPLRHRFISEDPLRASADRNYYSYVSNSPLNLVDPFGLYEEDVHRDLTVCLAKHVGLSDSSSRYLGAVNQGIDERRTTSPFHSEQARRDWHFTTPERQADLRQAALEGSIDALGMYLHALQDSYSHAGYKPDYGHLRDLSGPDKTYNDPEKANRMARDTYTAIRKWMEAKTGIPQPDQWSDLAKQVDRFNRARTAHEKKKGLCQ